MPPKGPPSSFFAAKKQSQQGARSLLQNSTFLVSVKRALAIWGDLHRLSLQSEAFVDNGFDMLQDHFNARLSKAEDYLKREQERFDKIPVTYFINTMEQYPVSDDADVYAKARIPFNIFLKDFEAHLSKFDIYCSKFEVIVKELIDTSGFSVKAYRVAHEKYCNLLEVFRRRFKFLQNFINNELCLMKFYSAKDVLEARQKSLEILSTLLYSPDVSILKITTKSLKIMFEYEKSIFDGIL